MKTTIGMDLGDKKNQVCVLDEQGEVLKNIGIGNTRTALTKFFSKYSESTVAIETGTHSPWISRLLKDLGCDVVVGNARKLRAIWDTDFKTDVRDAEMLAQLVRFNRKLMHPVEHRSEQAQIDLEIIKARDALKKSRRDMINHIRCVVKSLGYRLPGCGTATFHKKTWEHVPDSMKRVLLPIFHALEEISESIRECELEIEALSNECYPETQQLRKVNGVGPITALAYILTLETHERFEKSRSVGAFLGLTPKKDQSGETDRQLPITKAGNRFLRCLLVNCAQHIMGPFGKDSHLQRFGESIARRGGKRAKKRAVIAIARKLAVLLHTLWKSGADYDPFYGATA